jgi:hypothetical protein
MNETLTKALVSSFLRKIITYISGILLASGWINAELSDRMSGEAVGLIAASIIAFATSSWLSYKNVILEFVKTRIGIALPPSSTIAKVSAIAATVENKAAVAKGEADPLQESSNAR